jgi:hypothetical protein
LRARSAGAKPLPLSLTTSRVVPGAGRLTATWMKDASECFWTLRIASRAAR